MKVNLAVAPSPHQPPSHLFSGKLFFLIPILQKNAMDTKVSQGIQIEQAHPSVNGSWKN